MNTFLSDIRGTLLPGSDPRQGPLPPLLIIMTVVAGVVDSFSFLKLGHVFVANSTGNILFIGFALAHAPGFSITESLLALAAFIVGAGVGGRLSSVFAEHRAQLLAAATAVQATFIAVALVVSVFATSPVSGGYRSGLVAALGVAMGIQNATARKLAVPDLTTTVLTMTITGLGADNRLVGGPGSKAGRRLLAIAGMLVGALIGATLALHEATYSPLIVALVAVVVVAVSTALSGRANATWTQA